MLVLESESACGHHASGRSVAFAHYGLGNPPVRTLTALSMAELAEHGSIHPALHAGVTPIGLEPRRRTVISFPAPEGEGCYLLPEGRGQLLASSMDQTPSQPCDAAPEEIDIAIAADRVEQATTLPIRRISHSWAGLIPMRDEPDSSRIG